MVRVWRAIDIGQGKVLDVSQYQPKARNMKVKADLPVVCSYGGRIRVEPVPRCDILVYIYMYIHQYLFHSI